MSSGLRARDAVQCLRQGGVDLDAPGGHEAGQKLGDLVHWRQPVLQVGALEQLLDARLVPGEIWEALARKLGGGRGHALGHLLEDAAPRLQPRVPDVHALRVPRVCRAGLLKVGRGHEGRGRVHTRGGHGHALLLTACRPARNTPTVRVRLACIPEPVGHGIDQHRDVVGVIAEARPHAVVYVGLGNAMPDGLTVLAIDVDLQLPKRMVPERRLHRFGARLVYTAAGLGCRDSDQGQVHDALQTHHRAKSRHFPSGCGTAGSNAGTVA
mmetsp:Transcript_53367/g.149862  ORF Transcript_53367/g.149862 Transcript_53367/m.149862 type:complete len:268 (-) Transcript_53367:8-811(-)